MSDNDSIRVRSRRDLAQIVMNDLQGVPTCPLAREESLLLMDQTEAELFAVRERVEVEQRHESVMRELAQLRGSVEAIGVCLIELVRTLERREG